MQRQEIFVIIIQIVIPTVIISAFGFLWYDFFLLGVIEFDVLNMASILGTIIQGMSALLSIAIAVLIFRIQSLENRNQSLEQTTLHYITQLSTFVYAQWTATIEEHIEKHIIADQYRERRMNGTARLNLTPDQIKQDSENQHESLMVALNLHRATKRKISTLKIGAFISTIVLMLPIIFSLLLFIVADSFEATSNYYWVSALVLLCVGGISILIGTVAVSTISD